MSVRAHRRNQGYVPWTLLLLALALLAGCASGLPSAVQIREAPQERLASLLAPLQARVKSHPDDDVALRRLALVEIRLGRTDDAVTNADRATRVAPFTAPNFLVLGEAYQAAGNPTRALSAYAQAASLDPKLVLAYVRYAQVQFSQHDDAKALRALDAALQQDPHDFDVNLWRARVLRRQQKFPEAIAAIESARAERPHDAGALLLHVRILDDQGYIETALTLANQGLQAHPHDRELQVARVRLLRELRQWDAALEGLAQIASMAPLTADESLLRVKVLEGAGRDSEAAAVLAAVLKAHPDYAPAHTLLARRLALAGKAHQALSEAQEATALAPEEGEAHYWEAVAHFELGEPSLGDAALSEAARTDPHRLAITLLRAERSLARYQPGEADRLLGPVLSQTPDLSAGLLLRSALAALTGGLDGSERLLNRLPPSFAPAQVAFARLRIAYLRENWPDVLKLSQPLLDHPQLGWRAAYLRGTALLNDGEYADGLTLVQPYLERERPRLEFFRLAGYLHLLQGDPEAARRAFEGGLAAAPGSPMMIEGLSRIALERQDWSRAEALLKRGLQNPGHYRALFLERLARAAQHNNDASEARQALERFLDLTDPAKAGSPSQPASDLLYGGYFPDYDITPVYPAIEKKPAPIPLPDTLIALLGGYRHAVPGLGARR